MAKYEVIAAGLYGVQGEIPVGTIVDLKDEPPESMGAKIRKVGAKVAAPDDEADALRQEVEGLKAEAAKLAAKK